MLDVDENGTPRYEDALKVAAGRHDISIINVFDPRERTIPNVGLVHVKDSESGDAGWVDTGSRKVRAEYAKWFSQAAASSRQLWNRYSIDNVSISTAEDYVKGLLGFFQTR